MRRVNIKLGIKQRINEILGSGSDALGTISPWSIQAAMISNVQRVVEGINGEALNGRKMKGLKLSTSGLIPVNSVQVSAGIGITSDGKVITLRKILDPINVTNLTSNGTIYLYLKYSLIVAQESATPFVPAHDYGKNTTFNNESGSEDIVFDELGLVNGLSVSSSDIIYMSTTELNSGTAGYVYLGSATVASSVITNIDNSYNIAYLPDQILQQLSNIGLSTIISSDQWIKLSTMQSVDSGDDVTFGIINANNIIAAAITGTSINLSSGVLNCGTVNCVSLNLSGTFTTASIIATNLTVTATLSAASFNMTGALACASINTGSGGISGGLISATGLNCTGTITGNIINSITTITAGTGITATSGNIIANTGNVSANTITATTSGITANAGNITASSGNITAIAGTISGVNVEATTGNITASSGTVVGNFVQATTGIKTIINNNIILGGIAPNYTAAIGTCTCGTFICSDTGGKVTVTGDPSILKNTTIVLLTMGGQSIGDTPLNPSEAHIDTPPSSGTFKFYFRNLGAASPVVNFLIINPV